MKTLEQSNPLGISPSDGEGVVYFARVVDDCGDEWRYIGKASSSRSRLRAYVNNVSRIQRGLPRRTTPGQELFRGVHLALAKAVENDWEYELFPLLAVEKSCLDVVEQQKIQEFHCNLNGLRSWPVEHYHALELKHLA